jgi:hypothetical protein
MQCIVLLLLLDCCLSGLLTVEALTPQAARLIQFVTVTHSELLHLCGWFWN